MFQVATQAAATDPRTGTIDMDMITTGRTALDRDLVLRLTEELRSMLSKKKGQRLTVGQIRQIMVKEAGEASGEGRVYCWVASILYLLIILFRRSRYDELSYRRRLGRGGARARGGAIPAVYGGNPDRPGEELGRHSFVNRPLIIYYMI